LAYDLQAVGVDLRDLWRPGSGITPRYVLGLAGQFPLNSALRAAQRGGPEWRPWDPQLHLLAAIANLLNAANRQRAGKRTNSPIVSPPKKSKPVRRMTVAEIKRRQQARTTN